MRSMRTIGAVVWVVVAAGCRCGGGPVPVLPEKVVGNCSYTNNFSKGPECTDYLGTWTEKEATDDCKGKGSEIVLAKACGIDVRLGYCILGEKDKFSRITVPGSDGSKCASTIRGCEFFGGGIFDPAPICGGTVVDTGGTGLPTFQQPVYACVAPKAGEPLGKGPDGKVCTWSMISGATEPGRNFEDYASCDIVRTQRPYYSVLPAVNSTREDPRMIDAPYAEEVKWVKSEIQAAACVCCHSAKAPEGASNWFIESGPNFVNSFNPRGLAMGAGWIDTVGFGAFPAAQNNGFSRATPADPGHSIFPTTDDVRMRKFFEGELAARGVARSVFPPGTTGAGPLDEQRFFKPEACKNGEGVGPGGTMTWLNGRARYLYVLEASASSPTVPPNLDLPEGTIWRVDVPATGTEPLLTGTVKYGQIPVGTSQRFPASGVPVPLVSGKSYYLYVLADIAQPNARCLFTAP